MAVERIPLQRAVASIRDDVISIRPARIELVGALIEVAIGGIANKNGVLQRSILHADNQQSSVWLKHHRSYGGDVERFDSSAAAVSERRVQAPVRQVPRQRGDCHV